MNWFQRYGIPGAYFLGLIIVWVWAIYPSALKTENSLRDIGVLVGIFFIPAGYIVSVFEQWLYLEYDGIYRAAKKEAGIVFHPKDHDDEASIEAWTLLLIEKRKMKSEEIQQQRFIQDWIRRRMDVMAINCSIIAATVLAPITALLFVIFILLSCICSPWNSKMLNCKATIPFEICIFGNYTKIVLIAAISLVVFFIMWRSREKLKNQTIVVIVELYKQLKDLPNSEKGGSIKLDNKVD